MEMATVAGHSRRWKSKPIYASKTGLDLAAEFVNLEVEDFQ